MITKEEVASVSQLDAFARYKYFIKRVADSETIYSLSKNNELALAEIDGMKLVSIWSAPEFAKECAVNEWTDYSVIKLSLDDFKEEVGILISENAYLINVFSIKDKTGFVVKWEELWRDIDDELDEYI
ncbi:DUF2750 domain-containing protein [Pedobacter nutrimenti]|uniref:DUF2750 domain-containing protein n=1 Tax=Pedobacter nutrimenti TaxID=1241337 RepID=UPI00292E986F|nr:DUF2750 domain-containing protein [Pedobacter nutrimenti]